MKIEHVAVWTHQLEAMKEFYAAFFGARPGAKYTNPRKGFESYFLEFDGGARIELMYRPDIPPTQTDPLAQATGLTHLAISVGSEEAVDALTETLRERGYRVVGEPRRTGDGYYESVILDPDGNRVEITV
jgi:lactoylglutathione lyase